ncbi:MAG: DNA-binding response regulator, partial [Bacteroidota bacterium]
KVNVHSDRYYTTFSVKLPLNDTVYADSIKVKTVSVTDTQNSESPMRMYEGLPTNGTNPSDVPIVLLVEDNEDMRSYMSALLSNTYRVKETRNGNQALEVAVKEIPDIIITDLMMPEMNGEELLEQLRKDSKTQHIPVIMLTARTAKESKLSNLGKGADHYLTKPFDVEDLMIRIKSLLDQRKRIRDYHKSQFLTNPKAEDIVSSNDRFLQRIGHVVAKNFDDYSFTINEFATEMNMSRVQLYRKMKAIIGYSATDFIRQYRLKKASDYLKNKKGTVSEIAYEVGFNNLSYFTKCFKDVYGVTPSQYLKSDMTLKD